MPDITRKTVLDYMARQTAKVPQYTSAGAVNEAWQKMYDLHGRTIDLFDALGLTVEVYDPLSDKASLVYTINQLVRGNHLLTTPD